MRTLLFLFILLLSSLPALADHPRVLFDQGHAQAFVIEQDADLHLSRLATIFADKGYEVSSTAHRLTAELLTRTDALIISGAFKPLTSAEITAVRRFVERGGRLAVMIHIGPPLLGLLEGLGIDVANGVIREELRVIDNQPLNFKTSSLAAHPLTQGLENFSLYGTWPVRPTDPQGRILASSSARSWVDLTGDKRLTPGDAVQSFGVVVGNRIGKGEVLVFGDDALFQNRFLLGNNRDLAENLGDWLAVGDKTVSLEI